MNVLLSVISKVPPAIGCLLDIRALLTLNIETLFESKFHVICYNLNSIVSENFTEKNGI